MGIFSFRGTQPPIFILSMFESRTLESLLYIVSTARAKLYLLSEKGKPNTAKIQQEKSSGRRDLQEVQAACLRALQAVEAFANVQTTKDVCEKTIIDNVATMSTLMSKVGQYGEPDIKKVVEDALGKYVGVEQWNVAKWMGLPKDKLQHLMKLCGCEDSTNDDTFSQSSGATGTQAAGSGTVTARPSTLPPSFEDTF